MRSGGVTSEVAATLGCALAEDGTECATEMLKPRIGDYLVWGMDFRFLSQAALVRIFTIFDLSGIWEESWDADAGERVRVYHSMFTPEGFGAVIYPEVQYNFGGGFELHAGALLQLGPTTSKFGDPAAGGSMIWTRARYSF